MAHPQITTQSAVRRAFWELNTQLTGQARKRCVSFGPGQKDYPTDTRVAFVDFVEFLARDGQISDSLANRVTL